MSVEFRSRSHRIASRGISETTLSARRFAAMLTGGAAALAVVLAHADARRPLGFLVALAGEAGACI